MRNGTCYCMLLLAEMAEVCGTALGQSTLTAYQATPKQRRKSYTREQKLKVLQSWAENDNNVYRTGKHFSPSSLQKEIVIKHSRTLTRHVPNHTDFCGSPQQQASRTTCLRDGRKARSQTRAPLFLAPSSSYLYEQATSAN